MPKKKKRNTKKEFNFVFDRANNMRVARIKRGLSQSQMAKLVKTSQPTYSRIESGVTDNPDPEAMAKISAIFEMEPNRLRGAARIR